MCGTRKHIYFQLSLTVSDVDAPPREKDKNLNVGSIDFLNISVVGELRDFDET